MSYVRIPPFNSVVIRADKGIDFIDEWIQRINNINNAVYEAEFAMIGEFSRKCNTVLIPPNGGQVTMELVRKYNLVFYPIRTVRAYEGYAHTHEEPRNQKEAAIFGVACTDIWYAEVFGKAYMRGDHYVQGKLLGYPECCIKAFIEYWNAGELSPVISIARRTKDCSGQLCYIDPLLNPVLRYINVKAIPFWSCSYDCPNAHKWAEKFIKKVKKINKKAYKDLLTLLREPMEFTQINGIIEVRVGSPPWLKVIAQGYTSIEQRILLIPKYDPLEKYG